MKANELMIGDLINGFGVVRRVTSIFGLERPEDDGLLTTMVPGCEFPESNLSFRPCYARPIPLTAEIMEKNGFTRYRENEELWDVGVFRLDLGLFAVGIDNGCGTGMCIMPHGIMTFYCKYVHELQHALRLCGIEDDTIEL